MFEHNLGIRFKNLVKIYKYKKALIIDKESITFQKLDNKSDQIADYINKFATTGDSVLISSEKNFINFYILFACLKLGINYVFVDLTQAPDRINKIINTIKPVLLFSESKIANVHSLKLKKNINTNQLMRLLISKKKNINIKSNFASNYPAYTMFTSGSTGDPKGVVVSHQNVLNFIKWCKSEIIVKSKDIVTNLNPLFFDNSIFDIYGSIFNGASLLIVKKNLLLNPPELLKYLKKNHATIWFSVPTLLIHINNFIKITRSNLPRIRTIIFGGEAFPKKELKKIFFSLPKVRFINVYGPTECTCICSNYDIAKNDFLKKEMHRFAPLGYDLAKNFKYLIISPKNNKCKKGEIGELLIGGENVSLGYYNDKLNSKKFIQNPFHNSYRDIFYKSGDLVYIDKNDKKIYFVGRADSQIKYKGHRVELAEIENALNNCKSVLQAAVCFGIKNNQEEITAWISIKEKINLDKILFQIKKKLPNYMIPKIIISKTLPTNANGKIDKKILYQNYYDRKKN